MCKNSTCKKSTGKNIIQKSRIRLTDDYLLCMIEKR